MDESNDRIENAVDQLIEILALNSDEPIRRAARVMVRSGVLTPGSSGDQIDLSYLDTIFELYSSYHLGQIVEAA